MRVICIHIVCKHYQEGVDAIPKLRYEKKLKKPLTLKNVSKRWKKSACEAQNA